MYRLYTLALASFILFSVSPLFAADSKNSPPAPDFSANKLGGGKVTLEALRGKGVIINFWATWCPPCKAEMPAFDKIYKKYKKDGIVIYGINYKEDVEIINEYLAGAPVSFPILFDENGDLANMFNVFGLPATYFIDENGNLLGSVTGAVDEKYLEGWIDKLKPAKKS